MARRKTARRKKAGVRGSTLRSLFGLRESPKQTEKALELEQAKMALAQKVEKARKTEKARSPSPKKALANPEKSMAEYRKELSAHYERGESKKKAGPSLFMGYAPGPVLVPTKSKTYTRAAEVPSATTYPTPTALSKFKNKQGRRTAVAGSRRRKLH
jgi:hypothetical protein